MMVSFQTYTVGTYHTCLDKLNFRRIISVLKLALNLGFLAMDESALPPGSVAMSSISFPIRISIMTLNLWGDNYWPGRSESLSQLIISTKPDILLVQEASIEILQHIEKLLVSHCYIKPNQSSDRDVDSIDNGWICECNIFWDSKLLIMTEHGCESLNLKEYPMRSLFWVRLSLLANTNIKLFCSTVHFPWQGCETELSTGINQRIGCSYQVCEFLRVLCRSSDCIILGGDFNDDFHPIRIFNGEIGLIDVFELADLPPPITHPVRPSDAREEGRPNRTLDWILCGLPTYARVLGAFVKQIRGGKFPPPSDHYPVMAFIEITPPPTVKSDEILEI